jgi:hypothetical protein
MLCLVIDWIFLVVFVVGLVVCRVTAAAVLATCKPRANNFFDLFCFLLPEYCPASVFRAGFAPKTFVARGGCDATGTRKKRQPARSGA